MKEEDDSSDSMRMPLDEEEAEEEWAEEDGIAEEAEEEGGEEDGIADDEEMDISMCMPNLHLI